MTEKDWFTKLKTALRVLYDIDYEKLAFQKLWGIQLLILVKPEHHKKITHLQYSQVRTGIGNALGKCCAPYLHCTEVRRTLLK